MALGIAIEGTSLTVSPDQFPDPAADLPAPAGAAAERQVVLAGGCFWCTEAVYRQLDGVRDVVPGYAGGTKETADYETVCTGRTDHAEAIRITYDSASVSFGRSSRCSSRSPTTRRSSTARAPTAAASIARRSSTPMPSSAAWPTRTCGSCTKRR